METARLKRENADLKKYTSVGQGLIGVSSGIAALRQIIEKVAPTGSRVLISGPPGAGKEVVAREIHAKSPRQKAPFVVVNCASMHPDRMERVLFGVENPDEDGARKVGMFEQAHGGTLLLDEVADMPLETQGKIVRVLQDQQFERIGGVTPVTVDVRVVATTNRNLQDGISKGEFREDLYYRLNVVPIQVPALKERRQDIKALIAYFLEKAAASSGAPLRQLSDDALVMLESYDWPGNVRQLRNIIDWLMIMATGPANAPITAESLPAEITSSDQMSQSFGPTGEIMTIPLRDARELFEKQYLQAQLTRFEGNISKTAEFVGMERSALHRKLKSLGVGTDQKGNG
jgi:two-component system nitrogen regulation response regulator NtrX